MTGFAALTQRREPGQERRLVGAAYWSLLGSFAAGLVLWWNGSGTSTWLLAAGIYMTSTIALKPSRAAAGGALLGVLTAVLFQLNLSELPLGGRLIGGVAVAACLLPFVVRPLCRTYGFPFLHLFCLVQAAYLYVGSLVGSPSAVPLPLFTTDRRIAGLAYYAFFMMMVSVIGVALLKVKGPTNPLPIPGVSVVGSERGASGTRGFQRAVLLFAAGFCMRGMLIAGVRPSSLGALPDFVSLLRVLAFAAMVRLWLAGSLGHRQKVVIVSLAILDVATGFGTGALYQGAALVLVTFALVVAASRRVPVGLLVVGLTVAVFLNAAKVDFRSDSKQTAGPTPKVLPEALRFARTTGNLSREMTTSDIQASAERFAFADMLGYISDVVPDQYGYWDKRSYSLLPYIVVPRAIAPWKPRYSLANEFGRNFGLLGQGDFVTSANTPIPVEAYGNFGVLGLILIGAITGGSLGFAGRLIREGVEGQIVGAVVTVQLLGGIESGMTAWVLAIPTALAFMPIAKWVLRADFPSIVAGNIGPVKPN